ncbi:MAG: TolC family protein [Chlorobi bacterium]|nr:TolC family protein [Chlorobiota bacterium]
MNYRLILFFIGILNLGANGQTKDFDDFLAIARENSPLIFRKQTQNKAMEAELKRIKAFYTRPQISLDAGLLFAPIISTDNNTTKFEFVSPGAHDYYGYDLNASDGGQYQAFVSVEQPVFGGNRVEIASGNLAVSREINETEIKMTAHELERIVGLQYLRCLRSQKRIDAFSQLTGLVEKELQLMGQLTQSGVYKYSDYELLNIEYQNYQVSLEQSKASYQQDFLDLNIICGINDTNTVKLKEHGFGLNKPPEESFFLKKYKLDSLKLNSLRQMSEIKYQPQLSLFANGGLNAIYLPDYNRIGIGFGLKFSWTLFDGHQRDFNRERTNILTREFSFQKQRFITENSVRKTKILNQIKSIGKQISIKSAQGNSYDKLIRIYKTEFSQGELSAIEFVSVLRDKVNLNLKLIDLKMQKQALINTYNFWNY